MKQLIDLIIVEPTEDVHERGHKFPFTANEIFGTENSALLDKFFNEEVKSDSDDEPDEPGAEDGETKTTSDEDKDGDSDEEEKIDDSGSDETPEGESANSETKTEEAQSDEKVESKAEETKSETTDDAVKTEETKEEENTETESKDESKEEPQAETPETEKNEEKVADEPQEKSVESTEPAASEEAKPDEPSAEPETAILDPAPIAEPDQEDKEENKEEEEDPNEFELLEYLLAFLKPESELNPVLCGYFAKLIGVFINNRQSQFLNFIFCKGNYLEQFAYHSYNRSIAEAVVKILMSDKIEDMPEDVILDKKRMMIKKILRESENSELYLNSTVIFKEASTKKYIMDLLIEESFFSHLLEGLKSDNDQRVAETCKTVSHVLKKLRAHLKMGKQKTQTERSFMDEDDGVIMDDDSATTTETEEDKTGWLGTNHIVVAINAVVPSLVEQLTKEHGEEISTTYGHQ